jgi:outer membrane immunogenic protein
MDKLNSLLIATPSEFAAAFDAVEGDSRAAASRTTATFWLEGGITPAGAGFVWGRGEISYQGGSHAFRLSGLSIADIGAASICADGSVAHLRRLSDFNGSYAPVGLEAAGNDSMTYLKNEHGVVIKLAATDAAWRVNLSVKGLRVRLKHR